MRKIFLLLALLLCVPRSHAFFQATMTPRRPSATTTTTTTPGVSTTSGHHPIMSIEPTRQKTKSQQQQQYSNTLLKAYVGGGDNNDDNDSDDDSYDYERYKAALEHNTRRTDVRLFLTQRAIQSFITLLVACRDPHTVRWLENNYGFANLENYHGTGAFNLTKYGDWDSILLNMLQQPPDVVVVSARRRGRGHGGWSKNNPHLEDRFVEFEIDIEPPSLVTRILSVRQQIANEWVHDLATLHHINGQILASYHAKQSQLRDEEECAADSGLSSNDADCGVESPTAGGQMPVNEQMGFDRKAAAFDRNAAYYLNNKMMEQSENEGVASSPIRKGTFDLLAVLATQEALHRVLRDYQEAGDERSVSRDWLKQFYLDRLRRHFDGDGEYGRADDFLQDLLTAPPTTREMEGSTAKKAKIGLVDPLRIAQDVLEARGDVIDDWQVIVSEQVPSDHMELQRSILAVRMGKSLEPKPTAPATSSSSDPSFGQGAFE